ncbi:MAG: type II secretion system F family protein [Bdellovibrionaceae bacterium]|nr:type II secretion system F family protein [Pseudobdellovibrionaceae bacterium]
MSISFFILISGLALASGATYLLISVLLKQGDEAEALSWLDGKEPEKSKVPFIQMSKPLVHNFTLSYVQKFKNQKYRKKIQKKILTAGLSRELNEEEFIGLQILWGLAFPILFLIFNTTLSLGFPFLTVFLIAGVGFYFPHAYCNSERKKRYFSIISDLPVFVDVLALSTEAGLDFMGSIQKIIEKAPKGSILAEEFYTVLKDTKLGQSRREALENLDKRVDIPELTSVISVIKDAEETGASISQALKAKADQMRFERFARAEEAGAKASQKILIPMMIFIIPAVFIVVFAPAAFQFLGGS